MLLPKPIMLAGLFVLLVSLVMACTLTEAQLVEGILENVDMANGEITIVTKDGKTITLTIATEAAVETEGATSAFETLEHGASVEVEVNEDERVARRIKANLAKLEGLVVEVQGNQVTVESAQGRKDTFEITDLTRIELEDDFLGTVADLQPGMLVDVKFDPDSLVALKIDTEREEAEIEGVLVELEEGGLLVETTAGRRLSLTLSDTTRIELEDELPGVPSDLQLGTFVEVKFDPFTQEAIEVEVEEGEEQEIHGSITGLDGNQVTVELRGGGTATLVLDDRTRIEVDNDLRGTSEILQIGQEVEAEFDPSTGVASKIEVEDQDEGDGDEEDVDDSDSGGDDDGDEEDVDDSDSGDEDDEDEENGDDD